MLSLTVAALGAALVSAQNVPPPPPVLLTSTKSGVLPVLPTPFSGVLTEQGAIISKAPVNSSYTGVNGPAQVQSNEPAAVYSATLPSVPFNGLTGTTPRGTITGASNKGDTGVTFTVTISGLPDVAQYGPFVYHIHDMPVPADGNCTSTMGHFDPQNVGEYYTCDKANPQNCQVGDLAGKHGMIMGTSANLTFVDNYLSTDMSSPYFFGAKSIVIHTSNTTRLTCANFAQGFNGAGNGTGSGSSGSGTGTGTNGTSPTPSQPAQYTGAASKAIAGSAVVGLAAVFGLLM